MDLVVLVLTLLSTLIGCVALHRLTKPKLSREFRAFASSDSKGSDDINFRQIVDQSIADEAERNRQALATVSEAVAGSFAKGRRANLVIAGGAPHVKGNLTFAGPLPEVDGGIPSLGIRFTETYADTPKLELRHLDVHEIALGRHTGGNIQLHDCRVLTVKISQDAGAVMRFSDCEIGELVLGPGSVETLVLRRCMVGRFRGPPTAVTGSMTICANTALFDYSEAADQATVQGYRNLRAAANGHADEITEKTIHAEELRLERGISEGPVFKALNYLFDATSHYGNAPNRALAVVGFLLLASAALVTVIDRPEAPAGCNGELSGWHQELCKDGYWADLKRGAVISLQTITNPLGIVSTRTMLVPRHLSTSILLALQSVASIVLLAIAVIGIRRRFKIS